MAEKHIANAEASWQAICVTPDMCKVGKKVIPFDSFRDLSHDMVASPNVNARGTPVYRLSDWVQGTDSNAGSGVVSGTSGAPGHVQMLADDTTVRVNGLICARHETVVLMNNGNTVGRLQTDQGPALGTIENGTLPCNNPPRTSPRLEQLEALKEKLAFMDPDQLDEWVRFGESHEILDGLIGGIDVATDGDYGRLEGGARWLGDKAAQVTRAVLGFGKDALLGVGQFAYGAAKMLNPAGMIHTNLDAQILTEHIKLGNICLESLKQAAAAAGQELAKPVTDAWERGDHVEAVTRAGLEIGTLVVAIGQVAKAATATRATRAAGGATAAGAADDVARAGAKPAAVADDTASATQGGRRVEGSNGVQIKVEKPKGGAWDYAPNHDNWIAGGGTVTRNADGSITYTRSDGVSVKYDRNGYPDFSPHATKTVQIDDMKFDHYHDFKAANAKIGASGRTPPGSPDFTWHHHQDGKTMQLVPTSIHNAAKGGFPHAGGVSTSPK